MSILPAVPQSAGAELPQSDAHLWKFANNVLIETRVRNLAHKLVNILAMNIKIFTAIVQQSRLTRPHFPATLQRR